MARCAVPARASQFLAGGSEIPLANAGKAPAGTSQRNVPTQRRRRGIFVEPQIKMKSSPVGAAYSAPSAFAFGFGATKTELDLFGDVMGYKYVSPNGLWVSVSVRVVGVFRGFN